VSEQISANQPNSQQPFLELDHEKRDAMRGAMNRRENHDSTQVDHRTDCQLNGFNRQMKTKRSPLAKKEMEIILF
jgi:hypothetical protein